MSYIRGGAVMRKMKWASAFVTAILLTNSAAFAADLPGEQFVASKPPTNDRYTGIKFAVDENDKNIVSSLEAFTADGVARNSRLLTRQICNKIGDAGCIPIHIK